MRDKYQSFIFEDYQFDIETKQLTLSYSLDGKIDFQEEIIFDFDFVDQYDGKTLENALFSLWIMAGISYFKAAIPPNIIIKKGGLSKDQKNFFQKIYTHGLGEFFFQNNINPFGKINFKQVETINSKTNKSLIKDNIKNYIINESLIPLGGGKDSLTTIELLKAQGLDFETITVDSDKRFQKVSQLIGKNHIEIKRKISSELIRINKKDALNGHIPISAIWAFIFVVTAVLKGKQNIILSNEHSANEATTKYMGISINHQYSKTLEFEQDLQDYIAKNISPNIHYFSFLRPLTELHIAQIFCSKILDKYKNNFSSCNKNFKLHNHNQDFYWCAKCPKCAFIFTIFAPFLEKEILIKLFDHNLFNDFELTNTFHDLLGFSDSKPFECVGEIMEVRKAMIMSREKFPEVEKFLEKLTTKQVEEVEKFDYQKLHKNSMPKKFLNI